MVFKNSGGEKLWDRGKCDPPIFYQMSQILPPILINNQLIHGFEATDRLVFGVIEEEPNEVAVVGFRYKIATGAVKPDETFLVEQRG